MAQAIRIIGIDPGLRRTGWGVVESQGNALRFVAAGTVKSDDKAELATRLRQLYDGLSAILMKQQPEEAAVEATFVNKDASATLKLGQARGIAMVVPALAGLRVAEYAPNAVKKAVVVAAPHTSAWDFPFTLATGAVLGLERVRRQHHREAGASPRPVAMGGVRDDRGGQQWPRAQGNAGSRVSGFTETRKYGDRARSQSIRGRRRDSDSPCGDPEPRRLRRGADGGPNDFRMGGKKRGCKGHRPTCEGVAALWRTRKHSRT